MAWSYDTTLATDKDRVRLFIGDTVSTSAELSDEEIEALLSIFGSVRAASQQAALTLAAKYSRHADKWVGDLKILASQKAKAFRELATTLTEAGNTTASGVPSAGGIRISEKEMMYEETDRVRPSFRRGMFPYRGED